MTERLRRITSHLTQSPAQHPHSVSAASVSANDVDYTQKGWTVAFGDDDRYVTRLLAATDYPKGFPAILSQLTKIGDISHEQFLARFETIAKTGDMTHTVVIEDTLKGKIIASATALLEYKFTHGCGQIGHVEDVVVDSTYRGLRLGKRIVNTLREICVAYGCYKIILDCGTHNVPFYKKLGYEINENHMACYLKKDD